MSIFDITWRKGGGKKRAVWKFDISVTCTG
jgi:hypothetical protein